ncbi:MAG TPA: four helix bundle protein [Candidatus Saccharimonadales bacterium]|nr:four helix bundle protein [Candidatus Saccharimonadales bacterium]
MPNVTSHTKSIEGLRIYQTSRNLEDAVYELVKQLPQAEFYGLGNALRRSSAAVSHHITECHRRYSYAVKLEALHLARLEADNLCQLLVDHTAQGYGETKPLQDTCTTIVKQSWGLIRYLKLRQAERQAEARINASDELIAARH